MPVPEFPEETISEISYIPSFDHFVSTVAYFCTQRCSSVEFLSEFITELENIQPELRGRILRGFVVNGKEAQMAVDRAWLAESDLETPDWPHCLDVFEHTFSRACAWDFSELAIAAMRGIAIVLDEYICDHHAAHAAIERLVKEGGLDSHDVQDRQACVYFSEGNYAAAEEQWRLALRRWPQPRAPFDSSAGFAARSAGVAAARQGRWEAAADWFLEIPKRLPSEVKTHGHPLPTPGEPDDTWFIAAAYADAGFAWWKAGRPREAVGALIESWRQADTLPLGKENMLAFHTRKIIAHVIAWLFRIVEGIGIGDLFEPLAGMCSSAEVPEKMRELPEDERGAAWILLMRLERRFDTGQRAAQLGREITQAAEKPELRSMAAHEAVAQALSSGDVGELPLLIIAEAKAMCEAAKLKPDAPQAAFVVAMEPEVFQSNNPDLGCSVFIAALAAATVHGHSWREMVDAWRSSTATFPTECGWCNWFDTMEEVLGGSVGEAAVIANSYQGGRAAAMLASLKLLLSADSPPAEVFTAHARWLGEVRKSPWLRDTGRAFCQLVEASWQRAIATPALLCNPRLNIPVIRAACVEGAPGVAKAVRILLAAMPAVRMRLGEEMKAHLRSLAADVRG